MTSDNPVLLFIDDAALLSSIEFALSVAGIKAAAGSDLSDAAAAVALVVDRDCAQGLERLAELRRKCATPAILLATNPTRGLRASAAELNAILIEKPLLEDELMRTLNLILQSQKAAS
ncbi:histidine kinase [Sphingobium vermicomposti]|uniref:DNA-binding response OmpR family regulator n=1 Tax=Sphingobium vermicomposti TaxID=529005 RepID=A0A846M2G0_9SPHN|nr:histidine kinase [Sphingobium vermicomposti]NIJ16347.1 DNA-binding response OmpR family regulator [Sphingobium vermicomposti]